MAKQKLMIGFVFRIYVAKVKIKSIFAQIIDHFIMKDRLLSFLKDWMLVIGIIIGISSYLIYLRLPFLHSAGPHIEQAIHSIQPCLLFLMLFISFCRISPRQLTLKKWHLKNLAIQISAFLLLSAIVIWAMRSQSQAAAWVVRNRLLFETGMLCMICPTATSCAVVTGRLGGDMAQVVMYTIMINLTVAILVPLTVPLLYPQAGISFMQAFAGIIAKVFPLLILPCLTAWAIRLIMPKLHDWVAGHTSISFYLWSVALTFAITLSTKAIVQSHCSLWILLEMAFISLACCLFQFWAGGKIGTRYGNRVEGSQSMGQKNTVFGIWMGYTFWDPLLSVSGGMYTIWHNMRNTIQLYRHSHGKSSNGR